MEDPRIECGGLQALLPNGGELEDPTIWWAHDQYNVVLNDWRGKATGTFKNGAQRKFTGRSLLLTFSVPQFFFHVTTAYDILRHAGVDLAKKDFLGPPR